MVRDGVDAISGSFKFRGGFIQSPTRAVVSDSTPLRSRALRLLRLRRRARPAFPPRFPLPGRPERPRPGATGDETYYYVHARGVKGYRLRNHLPTVYTSYFILPIPAEARPTGPSASRIGIATSGPLRSVSGCARYGYPRPYLPVAVRVRGSARALARERAA